MKTTMRVGARSFVCALTLSAAPLLAQAQDAPPQAAQPAEQPAELPPLEVTAKSAPKKQAAKASKAKAAPQQAALNPLPPMRRMRLPAQQVSATAPLP